MVQYLESQDSVPSAIISAIIKILIWIVPVILLVKKVERKSPIPYLGLQYNIRQGLKWTGWIALALIAYFIIFKLVILKDNFTNNISFHDWLNTILLVGIIEEIVFRGFLFRKLTEVLSFWKANITTSLLFVTIHFPIWHYKGLFEYPFTLTYITTTFVLSIFFGFVYKKTESLWSVIIIPFSI